MVCVEVAKRIRRGNPLWLPVVDRPYLNSADPTRTRFDPHFIAKV